MLTAANSGPSSPPSAALAVTASALGEAAVLAHRIRDLADQLVGSVPQPVAPTAPGVERSGKLTALGEKSIGVQAEIQMAHEAIDRILKAID